MKRSLCCLLLLGALAACDDTPRGQLEPIPRPPGYQEPPKPEPARPPPERDPNTVVLRWKLAAGAPVAFRLEGSAGAQGSPLKAFYVLQRSEDGGNVLHISQQGPKAFSERATLSERGFILDGLGEVDRNLATLLLELPKEPVGVGGTWGLGTDLVNMDVLGPGFHEKSAARRHQVKLASLEAEGDEQVATILYDVSERVTGHLPPGVRLPPGVASEMPPLKPAPAKDKGKDKGKKPPARAEQEEDSDEPEAPREIASEVSFKGRGEFLVKAGRWRAWQGTLSSETRGYTPAPGKSPAQVPSGTLTLRLTALDTVPPELRLPEAKK